MNRSAGTWPASPPGKVATSEETTFPERRSVRRQYRLPRRRSGPGPDPGLGGGQRRGRGRGRGSEGARGAPRVRPRARDRSGGSPVRTGVAGASRSSRSALRDRRASSPRGFSSASSRDETTRAVVTSSEQGPQVGAYLVDRLHRDFHAAGREDPLMVGRLLDPGPSAAWDFRKLFGRVRRLSLTGIEDDDTRRLVGIPCAQRGEGPRAPRCRPCRRLQAPCFRRRRRGGGARPSTGAGS